MQGRSWMAALTLAAGLFPAAALAGETTAPDATTAARLVKLKLRIAGLSSKGCEVDVKPAHPGCKFEPISDHVRSDGALDIDFKDVQTLNADRDCTFSITIREPGQADRTVHRGLRVGPNAGRGQEPVLTCYLSSPSRVAKAAPPTTKR